MNMSLYIHLLNVIFLSQCITTETEEEKVQHEQTFEPKVTRAMFEQYENLKQIII